MTKKLLRKAGILEDETDLEMITLDMICLSLFGIEYIGWESETLKEELEEEWLDKSLFRIGASSLLADIERQLEHFVSGAYSSGNRHPIV